MSSAQCYCHLMNEDVSGMLRCDQCWRYFHAACLKSGSPSQLAGDIFFNFTCSDCNDSGVERVERMKKMSWLPVVILTLYNLQLSSTGKLGYYRWKEHICAFIESHWTEFFGPNRQKTQTWFGTVAGTLSSWCPVYFTSGMTDLKQSGWWKLTNYSSPNLDILTARPAKKQKSQQRGAGKEQKVEGLRVRANKSTIEAAIELRAKRDISASSGSKRKKKAVDQIYVVPKLSPQCFESVDEDFGSELTDNSQMSSSSLTPYDYIDQSSQMSRSSCRSDWLTEKDLFVADTLPEYLLKEDEGDVDDNDDEIDIDPCRLSPDSMMTGDNLPQIGEIFSTLHEAEYKSAVIGNVVMTTDHCSTSPMANQFRSSVALRRHDTPQQTTSRRGDMSLDSSSVDGDGFDRVPTGYSSEMEESVPEVVPDSSAKNIRRKRVFKKEPTSPPTREHAPTVVRMSLYEEKQLLKKLRQKDYASAIASSVDVKLKRFYRKLCVRQEQRERNLPVFDLDAFMQRLSKGEDKVGDSSHDDLCLDLKQDIFDVGDDRILDRYQHVQHRYKPVQPVSFVSRLIGSHHDQLQSIYSPYTQRVLKPFIRRDFESRPMKMRLLQEIVSHHHRNSRDWKPDPPPSIDYCYVKPQHIPAINALCREYFWPGIDMSESLLYPECSGVVLYRKLVIGFAFMVPVRFNEMYISFLFTHPEWRRAGIASFLLYHLTQTYRRKELTLHVSASNPAMLLYQKFGFKPEQFIVDFYDKYFPSESTECRHAFFLRLIPPKEEEDETFVKR